MDQTNPTMAHQIALAARASQRQSTGRVPKSVTVMMNENTLVVTMHGALSPAEKALALTPAGAATLQEFHRQLFTESCSSLRRDIKTITGVDVCGASTEGDTTSGAVVQAFADGTLVQVFLLAGKVPAGAWSTEASNG